MPLCWKAMVETMYNISFFNTYEYTNAPGGICNGITGGLYNENDIDLNRGYNETGKDNDWRWAEQWLPHTAWYLIAISSK